MNRRSFLQTSAIFSAGAFFSNDILALASQPNSKFGGVQVGVITYSFRSMPGSAEQILQYCIQSGVSAIELMGDAAEAFAGCPTNISDKKLRSEKMREWRESVSMDKFVELRKMFKKAGVSIYAFKPDALGMNNSDREIEYALKAAKALGAKSVTLELTKPEHSKRLGDLAAKHKVYIGYHNHTQGNDTAWDEALAQSPYNSINLDFGHYIAAGGKNTKESLLAFIEAKHDRITSMHMKDRASKENGAANMPWGQGNTPIKDVLLLMKNKQYKFPASIEVEYAIPAGSDAVKEVAKCVEYAKGILS